MAADMIEGLVKVQVGRPFYRQMDTGAQFSYIPKDVGGAAPDLELVIGFDRPTPDEVQGFRTGVLEAVLVELEGTPFVCVRFSVMASEGKKVRQHYPIGWQECPVHPAMAKGYVPPAPEEPYRWLLSAYLIDTATQTVAALRVASLSNEFSRLFCRTMEAHKKDYPSADEYLKKLKSLYRRFPVGQVVANAKTVAHTLGGD